jgi:hypothetical protein
MRIFLGIGIAMAAACGSDNTPPPDAGPELQDSLAGIRSGTRLKLRWFEVESARNFAGVFDSKRGETCVPSLWADGSTYCTPTAVPFRTVFKDAGCSVPLAVVFDYETTCGAGPAYFRQAAPSPVCGAPSAILKIYAAQPSTETGYYEESLVGCTRTSSGPYKLFELNREVPPTEFVKYTDAVAEGNGRLRFQYRNGADGSRTFSSTWDTMLEGACAMVPSNDSRSQQCLANFVHAFEHGEATCSAATLKASYRKGCPPRRYVAASASTCPLDVSMFALGAETSGAPLYADFGQGCVAATPSPDNTYYEVADKVPMAVLSRTSSANSISRFQPIQYSDGAVRLHDAQFYDTQDKLDCRVVDLADGSRRCFPTTPHSVNSVYYDDSSCQNRLMVLSVATASCDVAPIPTFVTINSCPSRAEVRSVGGVYPGPVYRGAGAGCVLATGRTHYQLGAPVPLDRLAPATLVIDL